MVDTPQNCWQVTGPPGCGKTSFLVKRALESVAEHGGDKVLVASLTRAAAYEFTGRGLQMIPPDQIGTLHMICKRALGNPVLTVDRQDDWTEFLRQNGGSARFQLTGKRNQGGMDRSDKTTDGDDILQILTIFRSQNPGILRVDPSAEQKLTTKQTAFIRLWQAWKDEAQLMDFTDLLEECLEHVTRAPGDPRAMFADEAQDWSRLEVELFRDHWGQHAEDVFLIGDEDQTIYSWRGADPRIFLDHPVPPERKILLSQSYRVPAAVRDHALTWIDENIRDREPVEYKARENAIGSASQLGATYRSPRILLDLLERVSSTTETWMVLGSCDYMLRPLIKGLRARGIPYANPYRAGDKAWNPLRLGTPATKTQKGETTRLDRVLAFLMGSRELRGERIVDWQWRDIALWCEPLRAKGEDAVMVHGGKTRLKELAKGKLHGELDLRLFAKLFVGGWDGDNAQRAFRADLEWWFGGMLPTETPRYAYFRKIIETRGQRALIDSPRCWVGTIHSAKGGEADCVVVFPDLSKIAYKLWWKGETAPTVRLFYVAMTRARNDLILCYPESIRHVEIYKGLPRYQRPALPPVECEVPF